MFKKITNALWAVAAELANALYWVSLLVIATSDE